MELFPTYGGRIALKICMLTEKKQSLHDCELTLLHFVGMITVNKSEPYWQTLFMLPAWDKFYFLHKEKRA